MAESQYSLRGIVPLALVSAAGATLCDLNHVVTGTLSYPAALSWGQPWWPLPGFTVAFVVMAMVYRFAVLHLPGSVAREFSTSAGTANEFFQSFLLFVLVYLLSGSAHQYLLMLNLLFYGSFALRLYLSPDRVFMTILAVILGGGGVIGEGVLSWFGLVEYTHQQIFYVPWWLAGLYFHGAFALRDGFRFFVVRPAVQRTSV